jgi:hypothetical protein
MTRQEPITYRRTGPTLDFHILWAWIENGLGRPVNQLSQLRILLPPMSRNHIYWLRRRGIRCPTAQRIATHFGAHPSEIWGPDWAKGTTLT